MQYSDLIFKKECHGSDCAYFFTIDNNYWGHTRDYNSFHVYNKNTNAYTSYTRSEFENYLQGNNVVSQNNNSNSGFEFTGLPKYDIGGFNATPLIIIGAALLIGFLIMQK